MLIRDVDRGISVIISKRYRFGQRGHLQMFSVHAGESTAIGSLFFENYKYIIYMEHIEMQGNLMVEAIAEYIHNIIEYRRFCPFTSLEEAKEAYLLHESRINNKYYKTYCDEWRDKYNELKWAKGYRFGKRLRPRRGTKQQ